MTDSPVAGHGHRVRLDADKGSEAPPGVWRCTERAPGAGCWWIQPASPEAQAWLELPRRPLAVVQGHVIYPSRLMRPPDVATLF